MNAINTEVKTSAMVLGYTNGITKPASLEERLAVIYWKTGKDGIKQDSKSVSIPKIIGLTPDELQAMIPHCIAMLEQVQNKIVRGIVEDKKSAVDFSELTIGKCMEYLESEGTDSSGNTVRLTKESITTWFKLCLEDKLMLALSDKLGIGDNVTNEQSMLVENTSNAFKARIISLASGTTKMDVKTATSVLNAVKIATEGDGNNEDVIASKLVSRLSKMLVVKEAVDLCDVL